MPPLRRLEISIERSAVWAYFSRRSRGFSRCPLSDEKLDILPKVDRMALHGFQVAWQGRFAPSQKSAQKKMDHKQRLMMAHKTALVSTPWTMPIAVGKSSVGHLSSASFIWLRPPANGHKITNPRGIMLLSDVLRLPKSGIGVCAQRKPRPGATARVLADLSGGGRGD